MHTTEHHIKFCSLTQHRTLRLLVRWDGKVSVALTEAGLMMIIGGGGGAAGYVVHPTWFRSDLQCCRHRWNSNHNWRRYLEQGDTWLISCKRARCASAAIQSHCRAPRVFKAGRVLHKMFRTSEQRMLCLHYYFFSTPPLLTFTKCAAWG